MGASLKRSLRIYIVTSSSIRLCHEIEACGTGFATSNFHVLATNIVAYYEIGLVTERLKYTLFDKHAQKKINL